jgi:uncharacterized protein (TIGR03435 family)
MRLLQPLFAAALLVVSPTLALPQAPQSVQLPEPQAAAAPVAPQFDVAAIRVHNPEPHEHNSIWSAPSDSHFKAENVSLSMLIHWAFNIPESRIMGESGWINSTHFNIDAVADSSVDAAMRSLTSEAARLQKQKMVQALLADRFKLVTHTETRQLPIYALVVAKGGPKLGRTQSNGTTINHGRDHIEVHSSNSVAVLAEELSKEVGRDVVDKTGIEGRYNLKLQWTPDDRATPAAGGSASPASDSGPSIFTALDEQLGLKLDPQKGPVEVLVIDHAEMPSAN